MPEYSLAISRMFLNEKFPVDQDDVSIDELESIIDWADASNEYALGLAARERLVFAAKRQAKPDKVLVALAWCLGKVAEQPDLLESETDYILLSWHYRMGIMAAVSQPKISLAQIHAILDQFNAFVKENGFLQRTADDARRDVLASIGHLDEAMELFHRWDKTPKSSADPCRACEQAAQVQLLALADNDREAVEIGQQVLDETECPGAISRIRRYITRPLVRLKRDDLMESNHRAALKQAQEQPVNLIGIAEQMVYLVAQDRVVEALKILESSAPATRELSDFDDLRDFFAASAVTMLRLADEQEQLHFHLPEFWDEYREDGFYHCADLAKNLWNRADQIAADFDHRNGNGFYQESIRETVRFLNFDLTAVDG